MKRLFIATAAIAVATWISGCGGGGGGGNNPPPGPTFTHAVLNVDWPDRSRGFGAISSALSLVVTIRNAREDGTDEVWTVNRDVGATATSKRYIDTRTVKAGTWDVSIKLYSQADGAGDLVGTAGDRVTIKEDGTGLDTLAVTGVIATVEVPPNQTVAVGAKVDLLFNAKNASGAVIAVTPGSATWRITAGTQFLEFLNGQAHGLGNGQATVTATVDGKTSAAANVTCGATTGDLQVNAKTSSGTLIPNSNIQIFQGSTKVGDQTTTTGSYKFTGVPPGDYTINVTSTGYLDSTGNTATVTLGNLTTKDVTLTPNSGTVVINAKDTGGILVKNTTIGLYQGTTKVTEQVSTTGSATFTTVAPGDYTVKASATGYVDGQATITVTAGGSLTQTVTMTPNNGTLVVNVKDGTTLVKNATIQLFQGATKFAEQVSTSGSQTFQKVPTGAIDVKVQATNYLPGSGSATMTAGGNVSVDIPMTKEGVLTVNAKDLDGVLIPGANIQVFQGGVKVGDQTPATGAYTFNQLKAGATDIKVTAGVAFHDNQASVTIVAGTPLTVDVKLTPRGTPQASTSATRQTALTGNTVTIQVDVAVNDEYGNAITTLGAGAFSTATVTSGTTTYTFSNPPSIQVMDIPPAGPYSAFLAQDASASVGSSDHSGSRIQAVKAFLKALNGSEAAWGYFPKGDFDQNLMSFPPPDTGFTPDGTAYFPKIDALGTTTHNGTPLYTATSQAIDFTAGYGHNTNRAVIVFTDGKATEKKTLRQPMIDNAVAKGVKVYMVGLGVGSDPSKYPDTSELSLIAQSTGGTVMYATDATQLVSFYRTLSSLLTGSGKFYRTTWTIRKQVSGVDTDFVVGEAIPAIMQIVVNDPLVPVLQAPFYVIIR